MSTQHLEDSNLSQQSRWDYPLSDAWRAEVRAKYVPTGDRTHGQLSLNVGDIVWILETSDNGWHGGHKEGEDTTGWFPTSIVQEISRGDCADDSFCDDVERSNSALYTSDHRAVASPQAKGHRHQSERTSALQQELAEAKQKMESVDAERHHLEERLKELQRLQRDWEQERHRWSRKAEEWESKALSAHDECKRKEAELSQQKELLRTEKSRTRSLEAKMNELEDHCRSLEADNSNLRQAAEVAAASAAFSPVTAQDSATGPSRILFAESASAGHRTPSAPQTVLSLQPTAGSGSLQAPPGDRFTDSAPPLNTVSALPLTARQAQHATSTRHPSPRHGSSSWMPPTTSQGPPPSPHLRTRILSQRDVGLESVPQAPVRTLVSEFERRSNSQGAPMTREPSAPTNRQLLYQQTAVSAATTSSSALRRPMVVTSGQTSVAACSSATYRTASREAVRPMRHATQGSSRGQADDPETPHASPNARQNEDLSKNSVHFGMSPIKRHAYSGLPRGGAPPSGVSSVNVAGSYSPSGRTTISVQDRIRAFNGSRYP